ncbi:metallophosphoesterase [Thermogladius sp. 4427co]|uniref:metallophosphoesterase n=1 Tax=Thermogladius sp. 4427co TaxID=3450718 RepID=UPI003F7A2AB0
MIVGVISDSHDNILALEKVLDRILREGITTIIHLGDIISPFTVRIMRETIKGRAKVIGVLGNNDGDILMLYKLFADAGWQLYSGIKTIELNGRRLMIFHGYGSIDETENLAQAMAKSANVDAVLYGHTHKAVNELVGNKLLLNPGEVCGYLTGKVSYALLDLDKLRAQILGVE